MALDPISAGIELATAAVKRIWPDKSEEEARALASQMAIVQGQLDINRAEAASPSAFTSGWRPGIGWVCALALFFQYIARPALAWYGVVTDHPFPPLPGIDDNLWQLLLGMLGLGGLRTVEKIKGVA
jgi:hypothetical protein